MTPPDGASDGRDPRADLPWGPRKADRDGEDPGGLESRPVHSGRIVRLSIDRVRFPDGSEGELEMIRHRGAAAVLPYLDPPWAPDPRILLLRQYRYATGGWIWEVPAGMPDEEGEPWHLCALRELEEETGRVAASLRYLTRLHTTPGFTDEVIRIYAAWDLRPGATRLDEDEFVEVREIRLSEALAWVRNGRITDGKSIVTLLYAAHFPWEGERPISSAAENPFP